MVWGALAVDHAGRTPDWPALKRLGDASYSVYLVHGLAISLAVKLFAPLTHRLPAVALPLYVAAGIAAGLVAYAALERPLTALVHPARRKPASPAAAAL